MPENAQDSVDNLRNIPFVTFAVLTFNQEKFVRSALEGALSQTYEPMEIILSDDCSTDNTFEIMQSMLRDYSGNKLVTLRQTKSNSGTLLNVGEVAKVARGELLVLAAGDDLSKPQRTSTLVNAWQNSGAWGLSSKFDSIDEQGNLIDRDQSATLLSLPSYPLRQYFSSRKDEVKFTHGATSAYDMRLFDFLELQPDDYILSEDGALSVLINLLNKDITFVDDSLVCYRQSQQSLTNSSASSTVSFYKTWCEELAIVRMARSQQNRCQLFLRLQEKYGAFSRMALNSDHLRSELEKQSMCVRWRRIKLQTKINYLFKIRKLPEVQWFLIRMLPNSLFIVIKTLINWFSCQLIRP